MGLARNRFGEPCRRPPGEDEGPARLLREWSGLFRVSVRRCRAVLPCLLSLGWSPLWLHELKEEREMSRIGAMRLMQLEPSPGNDKSKSHTYIEGSNASRIVLPSFAIS